jgi:hypothetical protein
MCFLHRPEVDPNGIHVCRDQWGNRHSAWNLSRLTLDHVKDELGMGKRAPSDKRHLVAMCHAGNTKPPTAIEREAERKYLAEVEP